MSDIEQVERDAAGFRGRFHVVYDGDGGEELWFASAIEDREEYRIFSRGDLDDAGEPIARMLNAVPALLAEVERLRKRLAEARQEISDVRGALDAHGHDGAFEAAAKLHYEVARLRGGDR